MEIVVLVLMAIGVVGIVLPVLPGLLVVFAGVLIWAISEQSAAGWITLGLVAVVYLAGVVLQWAIPGKRLKRAGVPTAHLILGVICAIVLGILIPVLGLFLGFPLGIFLASLVRHREPKRAWHATGHALRAVGLNILIELATAFLIIGIFVISILFLSPS